MMSDQPPFVLPPMQPPMFAPLLPPASHTRSMGIKLLLVCGLALLMMLPALYVGSMVDDRALRASNVSTEISAHEGGPQNFLGPVLAVPYTVPPSAKGNSPLIKTYLFFPEQADAKLKVSTEERHRSIFKVPIFRTDAQFDAAFNLDGVKAPAPAGTAFDWPHAEIVIGVGNLHGAIADATLTAGDRTMTFAPSDLLDHLPTVAKEGAAQWSMLGVSASSPSGIPGRFRVTAKLRFSGAQRLSIVPYGKTTHVVVDSDWRSLSFDGSMLPVTRQVNNKGFHAEWSVPFIARKIAAMGPAEDFNNLDATALGVTFAEVADPYQPVNRSLKYSPLFIGLVFLSYFVFEATAGKRVHPAQYVLVGLAQTIFYPLLLSFSERCSFDAAFLLGGGATVGLLSVNAGWVFASHMQTWRALVVFSLLYTTIYLLLTLQDDAPLVGAVASFIAVAVTMYLTRSIDWYGSWMRSSNTPARPPFSDDARTSVFPGGVI